MQLFSKKLSVQIQFVLATLLIVAIASFSTAQKSEKPDPKVIKEFSYSYGYSLMKDITEESDFKEEERDYKQICKGMKAGMKPDSATMEAVNKWIDDRMNAENPEVTAESGKAMAYNLGYNAIANILKTLEIPSSDFHYGWLKKGVIHYAKGKTPKVPADQMEGKLTEYFEAKQKALMERYMAKQKEEAAKNAEASRKFLDENAKKEGVITTESGLQYTIIKKAEGAQPTIDDKVTVHYHGSMIDGKVFDSSVERGEPITFPLKNLIKGWQEAIPLMNVGSKYKFFIPAELAYGEDAPPTIGPNQALIFDIELIAIAESSPKDMIKPVSYSYGYMIGQSLKKNEFTKAELDPSKFIEGFNAGFEPQNEKVEMVNKLLQSRFDDGTPAVSEEASNQIAYGIGYSSSSSLTMQWACKATEFDMMELTSGYNTALEDAEPKMTMDEMSEMLRAFFEPKQQVKKELDKQRSENEAKANIEAGAKFLEENAKKEGVVTLESGLQYQVLKEGTGEKPTLASKVTTHYHGTLTNGSVFDSSVERGEPATFPLNGVIKGWQEGLQLMKKGAKYRFFIPHFLAYGTRSMGAKIPAGSTLVFDVELLEVVNE